MPDIPAEYLRYGGAALAVALVLWALSKLLSKKEESRHHVTTTCKSCGWQGQVSKYRPRCPSCNATL